MTTGNGGSLNYGAIFEITSAGGFNLLYSFDGSDGSGVNAGLIQGSDGNFYGITSFGGPIDSGTIFSLSVGLSPGEEGKSNNGAVRSGKAVCGLCRH